MDTSSIGSLLSGGTTTSGAGATQKTSSKDEFLKLLVAQLQNQNPLDPQKGAEFVAQLAQFASLEQAAQANDLLGGIQAGQGSQVRSGMTSLIGRTVTAKTDSLEVGPQGPTPMSVNLQAPAGSVKVIVKDAAGKEKKTIDLGSRPAGDVAIDWAAGGPPLPPGTYKIEIKATGDQGAPVKSWAQIQAAVSGVEFREDATTLIHLGKVKIDPGAIISVQ